MKKLFFILTSLLLFTNVYAIEPNSRLAQPGAQYTSPAKRGADGQSNTNSAGKNNLRADCSSRYPCRGALAFCKKHKCPVPSATYCQNASNWRHCK